MAARGIVVILLTTLLAPMVSAQVESSVDYGYGAILSDNPCLLYTSDAADES